MNTFLKRTRTEKAFVNDVWQCEIFSQLMLWRNLVKESVRVSFILHPSAFILQNCSP